MSCGTFNVDTVDAAKEALNVEYRAISGLLASEVPLICFVGRLDLQKGYDLMLEALVDVWKIQTFRWS
jgi:glycogen synthase